MYKEKNPSTKKWENTVLKIFFPLIILFSIWFAYELISILNSRATAKYISHVPINPVAIDSIHTDSITKQIMKDNLIALEGYRAMEQSFSILQSATGIIEIAMAFVALGIPLFLFAMYFFMGKDISQIRDAREEVVRYKDEIGKHREKILEELDIIRKEKDLTNKAVLSSFKEHNPVYAQIETKSIRQNIESKRPNKDYTDEELFLIGGTYYIDKKYKEALNFYEQAHQKKPSEPLYSFHLGLTYDDEFSSRKFNRGNRLDEVGERTARKAIEFYQKAADGWDESDQRDRKALAMSNMAFTYLEIGKPSDNPADIKRDLIKLAYQKFLEAEKENRDDPYIVFGMAIAAHYLGEKEKAWEHFEEAEKREYAEKEQDYHKMYSRLQFRFMREEVYQLFKIPQKKLKAN